MSTSPEDTRQRARTQALRRLAQSQAQQRISVMGQVDVQNQELAEAGTPVNTSPFVDEGASVLEQMPGPGSTPENPNTVPVNPQASSAAQAGVAVTRGLPAKDRLKLSFAQEEALKVAYLEQIGLEVRRGPQTNELEWFDVQTRRWTPIDEAQGLTVGDVADVMGSTIPIGLAGAGEALGGPLGAGAGLWAGEIVNGFVRRAFGIEEELNPTQPGGTERVINAITDPLPEAAGESVFAGVGHIASGIYKGAKKLSNPINMTVEDAQRAKDLLGLRQEDLDLIRHIENATGERFLPTTGQLTDDEYLKAVEQQLRDFVQTRVAMGERIRENESTLEAYFRGFSEYQKAEPDAFARMRQLQEAVTQSVQDRLKPARNSIRTKEQRAFRAQQFLDQGASTRLNVSGISAGNRVAQDLRARAEAAYQQIDTERRLAYEEAKSSYGYDPATELSLIKIPITDRFREYYNGAWRRANMALSKGEAAQRGQLVSETMDGHIDHNIPIDLHRLEENIKYWKRARRTKGDRNDATTQQIDDHINELIVLRNTYLQAQHPEVLLKIETAANIAKEQARIFDHRVMREMFQWDDQLNRFNMSDPELYSLIVTDKSGEAFRHFMRIVNGDPQAHQTIKEGIYALYKAEVIDPDTRLPKLGSHRDFMRKYENQIDAVFTRQERQQLQRLDGWEDTVARARERLQKMERDLRRSWPGHLERVNPNVMVNDIMRLKRMTRFDAEQLARTMENYGQIDNLRKSTSEWVWNRIYNPTAPYGERLKLRNLDQLLDFTGQQDMAGKIQAIMGPEYVDNLRKLHRALTITSRTATGGGISEPKSGTILQLFRAFLTPPLTKRGRLQTALVDLRYEAATRALGEVLLDHKKLDNLIRADRVAKTRAKQMEVLSAIGAAWMLTETDIELPFEQDTQ